MTNSIPDNKEPAENSPDQTEGPGFVEKLNQWRKQRSWRFWLVIVILISGISWYLSLPAPDAIKVYLNEPGLTNLAVEKPVPDPVVIEFSDSVAELSDIDKPVKEGVSLSPFMQGEWKWKSDRRLQFTPAEDWKVAQSYSIKLEKTLFPSRVLLDTYHLGFDTAEFSGRFTQEELYQDPVNPKIKKMVTTIQFSHRVNQENFKSSVKLIMKDADTRIKDEGRDYPFSVSFNKVGNEAYIQSDAVDMPMKDQLLMLTVDDGVNSKDGHVSMTKKLHASVSVPGMYNFFRISSANISLVRNKHNDPEQVLIVETTDGVHEDVLRNSLEVFLLPIDRPKTKTQKAVINHYWGNVTEIGPEILDISQVVNFEYIPAEHEFSKQHSFKLDVPPHRHLYIRVNKGIESAGGYILAQVHDYINRVPEYPREIEIMGKGSLLNLSGDKKLSIISRGNQGLHFQVGYVMPDQIQHLVSQTQGEFQNPSFKNYWFDEDNITQRFEQHGDLPQVPPGNSVFTSFDFSSYLQRQDSKIRNGVFMLTVKGWDPVRKRTTGVAEKRLILITDLGVMAKKNADNSRDVFVMSVDKGRPVQGAKVNVLGINGVSVFSEVTDSNGHVSIPDLKEFKREKKASVIFVTQNNDLSFIPYDRNDRRLDMSQFDVGGVQQYGKGDVLSAYLFSDRGIYRPGDSFNIGMIVKSTDWTRDLKDIPLQVVVTDPRGLVIKEKKFPLSDAGFESLTYNTRNSSPTGEYEVKLYLVKDKYGRNLLGSTTVKLEEFLPDRMKISSRFSQERSVGWVHPKDLTARVSLKNLYGTPASERRISSSMTLSPYNPVFQKYSAFRFFDPLKAKKGFTERLTEELTDEEGQAEITLDLERFASASYNVSLYVNGFEAEGGRSVSTERSLLVSPREFLIGYKSDGSLDYVGKDSLRQIRLIAVDPSLELTGADKLKIELLEQRYISALVKQDNGTYKYQSVLKEKTLNESEITITDKGLDYKLPTEVPGDFILLIKDVDGLELNKVRFSVAGEANLAGSLEKNAELQVRLNKKDYQPGEMIEVNIRAPYAGAGLITIERDKVYDYKWFSSQSTNTVQTIRLPHGLEGNAYVNVSFIRDIASREIFTSPLSYGVAGFTVNRDARKNNITLDVPYLLRPGDTVDINYQTQHPGKIVVFAVDEGILQVANYSTPSPLKHFFRKRALEVETMQILDQILPEYSIVREISAAGGGMMDEADSANLNPFKRRVKKPVAYWSGVIDTDGTPASVSYTVPDYFNGSLRFMAVAVSSASMGVAEKKSLSRGHFIISPNVPTFVAPEDEFTISVNVANNVEGSGKGAKISLILETSDHLKVVDNTKQELVIDEGREKSVTYRIRARKDKLGSATIKFTTATADKQATASVDLSVRPALAKLVTVNGGHVQNSNVDIEMKRDMYPEFRKREFTASTVPLGLSNGLLQYLNDYPHLCTEQLVSKVFPIVALKNQQGLAYDAEKASQSVSNIIDILRSRQNSEGAFGFWAANSHVSEKQSLYVSHFLYEAVNEGFSVPEAMIKQSLDYARQLAQQEIKNLADARVRAYAIYLLTLNGEVTTRYLNDMREQMDKFYKNKWEQEISRAYMAAAYKLLRLDDEANNMIDDMSFDKAIEEDYSSFYDTLSRNAQLLFILSRHFKDQLAGIEAAPILSVSKLINNGSFNTLSASYSILALDAYADAFSAEENMKIVLTARDATGKKSDLPVPESRYPEFDIAEAINSLNLDASATEQPVFYQATESGFDRSLPTAKFEQGLEIHREYKDANGKLVSEIAMGEELEVHVQFRTTDGGSYYNIAIVDLLPGGFELVLDESRDSDGDWRPDYIDLREDRIIIYGHISKAAEKFVYKIKATNKGQYVVPPPYAESMYNRKIIYRGLGSSIKVE